MTESQRRCIIMVGGSGDGSPGGCGGESSRPGGRWVRSASESMDGGSVAGC
jgi:hypothetical protein